MFDTKKATSAEEINEALLNAAGGKLDGILACSKEELVSVDFNNNTNSSIVDLPFTRSIDPHMHKVLSWYDNEYGYSNRMLDVASYLARKRREQTAAATS